MSNPTKSPRFGRRSLIIGAAAIGFAIGGYSLASAAQGSFFDNSPAPTDASVPGTDSTVVETSGVDSTVDTIAETSTDDTGTTADDSSTTDGVETEGESNDVGDDHGTDNTNGSDDHGASHGHDGATTTTDVALPDPFTTTYASAGGSITVSWDGSKLSIDSIDAAQGFTAEIKDQQWDRVRVEFKGNRDSRIEVRIDSNNTLRVSID